MANQHYYKLPIDSEAGKRLSRFWQECRNVAREAEKYCRQMGCEGWYGDPRYFEGGITAVYFPEGYKVDTQMWKEVSKTSIDLPGGKTREVSCYVPNVSRSSGIEEVPSKDYQPTGSFDTVYDKRVFEKDGKYYVRVVRFRYDEPPGHSGYGQRVASRSVRKAIKAEVKRASLPVIPMQEIFTVLEADLQEGARFDSTPVFFPFNEWYYVSCPFVCRANGMESLSQRIFEMNRKKYMEAAMAKED